jgi:hypothetical protein
LERKLLLATGKVDADSKDNYSQTPLYQAAGNGHEAVAKLLLATGKVDADSEKMFGQTPLSQAAGSGHEAVVKLLLATGKVDADSKDDGGQTPLLRAAWNGHEAVVKLLLATGKVDGRASQTPSPSPPPRPRPADSKRTLPSLPATSYATPTQKYFCVLKGCSYSKRPGFPTYDALEMHVSTVHPKRYQDLGTKAKLRQQEPLHSTIPTPSPQINREYSRENTSLYGYNSRLFCNVQDCPYDANNFIGFTTKEQLNDHRENLDHSSMKRTVVRPVVDDPKQQLFESK